MLGYGGAGDPSPITTWINIYTLPAWAALRFPEREIEFRKLPLDEPVPKRDPETLLIGLRSLPPGHPDVPHPANRSD